MKKLTTYLITSFIFFVFLLPQQSSAYLPTDQFAVKLNETTFLFGITYKFSFMDREIDMPIQAIRGNILGNATSSIRYEFFDGEDKVFSGGEAYAVILSDTPIEGGAYRIPYSGAGSFMLVSLLTFDELPQETETLRLQVTRLPFKLTKPDTSKWAVVGKKELQQYTTPVVDLGQ